MSVVEARLPHQMGDPLRHRPVVIQHVLASASRADDGGQAYRIPLLTTEAWEGREKCTKKRLAEFG